MFIFSSRWETRSASAAVTKDTIPAFYKDEKGQLSRGQIICASAFGILDLDTPRWIRYSKWIDASYLNKTLQHLVPHLTKDWISDRFSESLRKSASLNVKLRPRNNGKIKIKYCLRLATELLLDHCPPHIGNMVMNHLSKWMVPTLRCFPQDDVGATNDIRIATVEKRSNEKIIIPQGADSLDRLLDFHYISDYVHFYKAHQDEWNQQFVPERVFEGNRSIYRLVLTLPPRFSLYSSSNKLYLEIMEPDEFLVGETKCFRMTCDESRATCFVFKDRTTGNPLLVEEMSVQTRYDLCWYDPSSMCTYPIYMGLSGQWANQNQSKDHEQLADLLDRYRTRIAVTSTFTVSTSATVETVEDGLSDVNIFRAVSEGVMNHPIPPFAEMTSDRWVANVLYHPSLPLLGFRAMSLEDAFELVVSLYNWVVHSRQLSDSGKIFFDVYVRHGHTQREPFSYGIGCDPQTGIPTVLNTSLMHVMDTELKRSWESVVLEVKLDYLSYLRLFPDCEGRYQWLTRVFSRTLSAEALRQNKDYQMFKSIRGSSVVHE